MPKKQDINKVQYITKLLSNYYTEDNTQKEEIQKILTKISETIESQLQSGQLKIILTSDQKRLNMKKFKNNSKLESINSKLMQNQEQLKEAKRRHLFEKKSQNQSIKEYNDQKAKENQEKIKKWKIIHKEVVEKKDHETQQTLKKQQQQEEKLKREQKEQNQFRKLEKKKIIEQKLRKIDQNKNKRQQIIKKSIIQYQTLNPKYIEIEKKYKQLADQQKFQEDIMKKNHKLTSKIDHQNLKQHQKEYLNKVYEKKQKIRTKSQTSEEKNNQQFQVYFNKKEKQQEQITKLKRRKQYQEKIKEIPVQIDQAKKVKVQIEIDKGKNPLKYHFLGQKALNNFQIYGQFQDFEINVNYKQLGKKYLHELPQISKTSRVSKSSSLNNLSKVSEEKIKYQDYLKEIRTNRPERSGSIEQILNSHKQKSKLIQELSQKSKQFEKQAKKKLDQIQKNTNIKTSLKKSKQMDEIYMNSIKAKLACLEMN